MLSQASVRVTMHKLLVIQVAGFGHAFATEHGITEVAGLALRPLQTIFPAVTCPVQATLRTGLLPAQHGMVANGFFDPVLRRPWFWEQASSLVQGPRIWERFRARGGSVGMAFFQQSLGESVDQILSPAPIHTHGGGMIMGCYSQPPALATRWADAVGRPFKLRHYWGPLASVQGSEWITEAVCSWLAMLDTPDLCFVYLPGLDYDLQRWGPKHPKSVKALKIVCDEVSRLIRVAQANGYEVAAFGDYAITPVTKGAIFPNRALREAGLFSVRKVRHMAYPDFHTSQAFALVDHQVALVHCPDAAVLPHLKQTLAALDGVGQVLDREAQTQLGVAHARSGEVMLVAEPGAWFAYPWWDDPREAPDYAAHVDIHNKPGYDPCELFFGQTPFRTSLHPERIRGTHGLTGEDCKTAYLSTMPFECSTLIELIHALRGWLSA